MNLSTWIKSLDPAQEQGFIEALLRDPYDRVTMLVYADWLDEAGDEESARQLRAFDARREELIGLAIDRAHDYANDTQHGWRTYQYDFIQSDVWRALTGGACRTRIDFLFRDMSHDIARGAMRDAGRP